MRMRPSPITVILLLAFWGVSESPRAQGRPFGGLTGVVLDEAGNPIIGAVVRLLPADTPGQPVKTLRTDMEGKYLVKKLAPGTYRVRAEARGFLPMAHVVQIKPHVLLNFDFELRRTETWVERREDRDDYRWAVRASRRPVLRFNKNGEAEERFAVRLPNGGWRGHMSISSGFLHRRGSSGTWNFALLQELGPWLELGVAAQTNGLWGSPGRWELGVLARPLAAHHLRAAMATTEWRDATDAGRAVPARRLELRIADRWHMLPELSLVGGVDIERTTVRGRTFWDMAPRLGLRWDATERLRLKASLLPFAIQDASFDLTPGGPQLSALYPSAPQVRSDGRVREGGHHWHIGVEHALGEGQTIEIAVFQSAPPRNELAQEVRDGSPRESDARYGVRVLYTRPLGEAVRATVGYAFGHRRPHPFETMGTTAQGDFHLLAGRVDATLTRTRTRVVAHVRVGRGWTTAESDPFYNLSPEVLSLLMAPLWERLTEEDIPGLPLLDPGLTLVITQELPAIAFLPGRWEAIIEARNLIAWAHTVCADGNAPMLVRVPRLIRGSLAVRF